MVVVVLQSCVQIEENLPGAYTKNVLSLCLTFHNTGEFTKFCKFHFYGACSLYYANEAVVFKYTNQKVYPDELGVKKKKANLFL